VAILTIVEEAISFFFSYAPSVTLIATVRELTLQENLSDSPQHLIISGNIYP
jgi:hypothetical protein